MNPLVTVVTMTYKRFDSLYETLDSVLEQKYENIELIISDDGSPNFPVKDITDYLQKKKRINLTNYIILTSENNNGTVKNINRAYKSAAGEYIVNLSCNDVFFSNHVISDLVTTFEKEKTNLLITSRVICDKQGSIIEYIPKRKNIEKILKLDTPALQHKALLTNEFYNMASGCVLAIRRDFIEKWGYFDEAYVLWEDGPFFTKYTKNQLLTFAYDIVSIKYDMGGVSNYGTNPIMREDYIKYNQIQRSEDIKSYGFFTREKIRYINRRELINNRIDLFLLYIRFPFVIISKMLYKTLS